MTVRVSDHLPIYSFVCGDRQGGGGGKLETASTGWLMRAGLDALQKIWKHGHSMR